jgi:antitoxin component YwqK of YwqJK toxin-antitoxin module
MRNVIIQLAVVFTMLLLASCQHEKVKVVHEEYSKGRPKTVYYFDSEEDAKQDPMVDVKDGAAYANKPISFDEERYYENGKLRCKGRLIKGQTCGLWQYFYETGVPQAKCYYLNGVTRDSVFCWYPSGKLKRNWVEEDSVDHRWHGFDFYENGKKSLECTVHMDSLDIPTIDGEWTEWFDNGNLKFKASIRKNWTVGKWQQWDEAGKLTEGDSVLNLKFHRS